MLPRHRVLPQRGKCHSVEPSTACSPVPSAQSRMNWVVKLGRYAHRVLPQRGKCHDAAQCRMHCVGIARDKCATVPNAQSPRTAAQSGADTDTVRSALGCTRYPASVTAWSPVPNAQSRMNWVVKLGRYPVTQCSPFTGLCGQTGRGAHATLRCSLHVTE